MKSSSRPAADDQEGETRKRPRKEVKLWDVPLSRNYAISLMHRETVSHAVTSTKHGYVLTASADGVVKFWKRQAVSSASAESKEEEETAALAAAAAAKKQGMDSVVTPYLEFVKSFTAHVGATLALCMAPNGDTACSVGSDNIIKVYDIATFDVTGMMKVSFANIRGPAVMTNDWLAVVNASNQDILLFSYATLSLEPIHTLSLHAQRITAMVLNHQHGCVLSADASGTLELWNTTDFASSVSNTSYRSKTETDYYTLLQKKTHAVALACSGTHYCVYGHDHKVRIYQHTNGKIVVRLDERPRLYQETYTQYGMDALEYGKRAATERELLQESSVFNSSNSHNSQHTQSLSVSFDPSGKYLLLPTMVGIKVLDWARRKLRRIIGVADASTLRFVTVCLCPGNAVVNRQLQLARTSGSRRAVSESSKDTKPGDALLVALAYHKRRLYVFSHRDPIHESEEQADETTTTAAAVTRRDVWNEAPDAEDRWAALEGDTANDPNQLGREAILRTTMGDVHLKLFANQVPRTIENFCGHARNGYYDKVVFHRVIKGFMIQTGDPLGDGTGGESIWGGEFEDEFVRE